MADVPTVKVRGADGRPLIINLDDFRPGVHVRWVEPEAHAPSGSPPSSDAAPGGSITLAGTVTSASGAGLPPAKSALAPTPPAPSAAPPTVPTPKPPTPPPTRPAPHPAAPPPKHHTKKRR